MDLEKLLGYLLQGTNQPNDDELEILSDQLIQLAETLPHLTEANKATLLNILLKARHQKNVSLSIALESLLTQLTRDEKHMASLMKHLKDPALPADQLMGNVQSLGALIFNNRLLTESKVKKYYGPEQAWEFYKRVETAMHQMVLDEGLVVKDHVTRSNRVVIMCQQLLSLGHAPSLDVFNFARYLINDYGLDVLVVNTREFSNQNMGTVLPKAKYSDMYQNHVKTFTYEDIQFQYFQNSEGKHNAAGVRSVVERVEAFDPSMILVVGARNYMAELFAKRAFVFMYPTSRDVPTLQNYYYHTWEEPDEVDLAIMEKRGIKDKHLFTMHPGFMPPPRSENYTREQFGLPEDGLIYVVAGMRLHHDVTDEFAQSLKPILDDNPKAHIAFLGKWDLYEKAIKKWPFLAGRHTFVEALHDVMAFYELCDIYLNPRRLGAGSIILFAQLAGLPTVSQRYGDSGVAVKDFPKLNNYKEMTDVAIRLAHDEALFKDYQEMGKKAAEQMTSREPLVTEIMKQYEHYMDQHAVTDDE